MALVRDDEVIEFRFYQNHRDRSGIWVPTTERFPSHANPKDWYFAGVRTLTRRQHAEGRLDDYKRV